MLDPETKALLLARFYTSLLKASECQKELPRWVDLEKQYRRADLEGSPRIDGALLKKAINLFRNSKSCASDQIVSEMLSVLDEDILDTLAEAFIKRILNVVGEFIWKKPAISPYVEHPIRPWARHFWMTSSGGKHPRRLRRGVPAAVLLSLELLHGAIQRRGR